jgi:hypothetical protein
MPQAGAGLEAPALEEAKTESFFASLDDPQWGHLAEPSHLLERTRISLSFSHLLQ